VIPESAAAEYAALVLTGAGALFAIWARLYLGGNWSAIVAVKQGHTLVRTGPYRIVRHPIYAGLLAALAGTAVGYGYVGGLLAMVVAFAAWLAKARLEESFLMAEFGAAYGEYRREVKTLIPFVL
jgi:protein-S-isoprenylcysteine O-methyltransferase Ste14